MLQRPVPLTLIKVYKSFKKYKVNCVHTSTVWISFSYLPILFWQHKDILLQSTRDLGKVYPIFCIPVGRNPDWVSLGLLPPGDRIFTLVFYFKCTRLDLRFLFKINSSCILIFYIFAIQYTSFRFCLAFVDIESINYHIRLGLHYFVKSN